ncbi:MAG: hypothetical protein D6679_05195 [Candidatus Hydrogenedentota bacterium]|nr:MAG: hypothetical protein D6679_05195 [Candidatus Hydrogenedentota bacterium]
MRHTGVIPCRGARQQRWATTGCATRPRSDGSASFSPPFFADWRVCAPHLLFSFPFCLFPFAFCLLTFSFFLLPFSFCLFLRPSPSPSRYPYPAPYALGAHEMGRPRAMRIRRQLTYSQRVA